MSDPVSVENLQEQIIELQTKIQFQEDTIHHLDKVIVEQNERLCLVTKRLIEMEDKVKALAQDQAHSQSTQQERPPHY